MRRVLLIGGYGGFGARIALRLSAEGWEVLVAGRIEARARAFCQGRPGLVPLAVDRTRDLSEVLARWRPFAVVDAAGPFQDADGTVPRACIAARCHYLDIADGRDFVAGIGTYDEEARAAGIAVIAGASSVPALSGAVVRRLANGMAEVRSVEMAISASNRATAGPSLTRAILSYIGRPIVLWRSRRWTRRHGWQDLRRLTFDVSGLPPLGPRLVGLADVPDLDLLPRRLPGRPAVVFRAGTELALQNLTLWLLSWLVRGRLLRSLLPLESPLIRLQRSFRALGSARSAMTVRVLGISSERRVERRWTLIADGDGPEIPGLAIPIVLGKLERGEVEAGATDAGCLLALDEFEPAFSRLSIRHQVIEAALAPPLYARIMGARYDALPAAVRAMHDVLRDHGASGRAVVLRGRKLLSRAIASLVAFPPDGEHDVHVGFAEQDGVETWTRDFGGNRFRSRLSQDECWLVERFGPLRFVFALPGGSEGLSMDLRRWYLGPLALPFALAPRSVAHEWEEDGRFQFDVPIVLPLVGLLVHYRGWLLPTGSAEELPLRREGRYSSGDFDACSSH